MCEPPSASTAQPLIGCRAGSIRSSPQQPLPAPACSASTPTSCWLSSSSSLCSAPCCTTGHAQGGIPAIENIDIVNVKAKMGFSVCHRAFTWPLHISWFTFVSYSAPCCATGHAHAFTLPLHMVFGLCSITSYDGNHIFHYVSLPAALQVMLVLPPSHVMCGSFFVLMHMYVGVCVSISMRLHVPYVQASRTTSHA